MSTAWNYRNNDRLHVTGDSQVSTTTGILGDLTYAPGGLADQIHAKSIQFTKTPANQIYVPSRIAQPGPAGGLYTDLQQTGRNQVITRYGVGGRTISGLQADMQASVFIFNPTILVIIIGTNDFGGGTPVGPGSAFRTSYQSVINQAIAFNPNIKIICTSITVRAEAVAAGVFTDGSNAWGGNTDIQFLCNLFSANCIYVDIINAASAYATAHPPVITNNQFTQDNLHPTPNLGKIFYGTRIASAINPI